MLTASLVVATSGLSTVLIINASAKQSYTNNNTFLISNVKFQVVPKNAQSTLTKQDYVYLRRLGFNQLIALAQASTHIYVGQHRVSDRQIDISGIDMIALLPLEAFSKRTTAVETYGNGQSDLMTSQPFSRPLGIVHPTLLAQLVNNSKIPNIDKPSSKFSIPLHTNNNSIKTISLPTLVSVKEPSLGNDLIIDIGEFYRLFPNNDLSSLLFASSLTGLDLDALVDQLRAVLPFHLKLIAQNGELQQGELTDSFHMNLLAMALLMFVVCLFIVINAVNLLINARLPWLKICRQLGFSRQVIFVSQIIEILLITFAASCAGIYLSIHLSNLVAPTIHATLEGLYGVEVGFGNASLLSLFLQVFGISLCGSIGAAVGPLVISKQSLVSSKMKVDSLASKIKWQRYFWLMSILFALSTIVILFTATALWLLLIATAMLILAGCCLLLANYPLAIDILYRVIPTSFVMLRISTKQSAALSGKTKVACCAFFIAATSNIGMNLMVDSFRGATVSWLESRLATDYYLYYDGNVDIAALGKESNVEVFQRFENRFSYKGTTLQQVSYPTTKQFKDALVFYKVNNIDSAWQAFTDNNGVFVNQQFAFEHNLKISDVLSIPNPSTQLMSEYRIKGIVYDFGNPFNQILLPLSQFNSSISKSTIYSINAGPVAVQAFKKSLNKQGIDSEKFLLTTKQLIAVSKNAFDRTFVITDGLNIVTLLVAALSLACAIIVLMNDVRPQNMLIRSLGVSAVKTQLLALFQYFILCLIALVFATPFGILLSWVLIYEINLQAFQWTYPLSIYPLKILQVYAVSLVVVLLIIAVPIINAGKRPLIEDIRWLN